MRLPGQLCARGLVVFALVLATAGCASTRVVHQWTNPDVPSARFKKVMVMAISKQPGIRRSFEDEFVAKLKAAGVDAVPSYGFITEDGPVEEPRLREAIERAAADATLVTRFVRVERKYSVDSGYYYPPLLGFGFYRGYTAAWLGYYEPATVYPYDVFISETSLYDTAKNQLIWSGTVETLPASISKDITRYVDTVIEALKAKNLLVAG
jgi:hypothetical protein